MINKSDVNRANFRAGHILLIIFAVMLFSNATSLQAQGISTDNKPEDHGLSENIEIKVQDGKFTIRAHSLPLNQIFKELSDVTGIQVVWQGTEIERSVSVGMIDRTIDDVLSQLLEGINYLVSYTPSSNGEVINRIFILPDGNSSNSATNITQNISEKESLEVAGDLIPELSPDEEKGLIRYDNLVKIEEISRMKDKDKATTELSSLLASHSDPIVRLNALTSLNDISSIDEQTLIQTVTNESDPRVKIKAIQYLTEKLDENPDLEKFLSMKQEVN